MAEEEVVAAPEVAVDQQNKRKLEDLAEPLGAASELDSAAENGNNDDDADVAADKSEAKRPRLEEDGHAADNGYQKDKEVDAPEEGPDQPPEDGEEEPKEAPLSMPGEQSADEQQTSIETEKPQDEAAQEPPKEDDPQPSEEITQTGDIQQPVSESQTALETQTVTHKMDVPNNKVGVLIGKAGDTIRYLQYNSGAKIQITRDAESDPRSTTRPVELIGTLESIKKAEKLIKDVIAEADAGGSPSLVARGFSTVQAATGEQLEIQVPNEKVGLIIGKGGETIKNLQTESGARIQLIPQHPPEGNQSKERTVRVTGDRKQIEMAREMIKEVMSQTARPSPLSGGYGQQGIRPRGPVATQWGVRSTHPAHFTGYNHQQRGPYHSQHQQYPPPTYGNFASQLAPRSNFGPSWGQRPHVQGPPPQANYNYGQSQGSEYGQPAPHTQSYSHGFSEGHSGPQQHPYGGHGGSQQTTYGQGGTYPGYGPQDQYGKSSSYGAPPPAPHAQPYVQPRPSQPGDVPNQGTMTSTQSYGPTVPPQSSYPYASSGPMQQSYPAYGSAAAADGYSHPQPANAPVHAYTQQGIQPVAGYAVPGGQQPIAYGQVGAAGNYGVYSSQPGYTEQPAATNAGFGYQGQADTGYGSSGPGSAAYVAQPTAQAAFAQPAATQQGYDQSTALSGGYGTVPAPTAYGKSVSPQPGFQQYDSSQMYGAHR